MKKLTGLALAILVAVPFGAARTSFAQSASQSMERAGSDLGSAAKNAYHGTATAVKDSDLTAKVKLALHDDSLTKGSSIHVSTVAGVVTLRGTVASADISSRAEKLTRDTSGVKDVHNHLHVANSSG
jgi:hyperosmotically inducible periplasmic protein